MAQKRRGNSLAFHPVTLERWRDLENLFGERGACGGCWCMWWRLTRPQYESGKGPRNKGALKRIIESGPPPGILAYVDRKPVGWCAVAPREVYLRLNNSRILQPIDGQPVWSVTCFFVTKAMRRTGVSVQLLQSAVAHAAKSGAKIIEGYPVEPKNDLMPTVFAYTGFVSAFLRAGLKEVARRSETRPIMRYYVPSV